MADSRKISKLDVEQQIPTLEQQIAAVALEIVAVERDIGTAVTEEKSEREKREKENLLLQQEIQKNAVSRSLSIVCKPRIVPSSYLVMQDFNKRLSCFTLSAGAGAAGAGAGAATGSNAG